MAHARFVDGQDSYQTISVNGKQSRKKFTSVDGGMSTGYFGALLHSIFAPGSKAQLIYAGEGQTNGRPVLVFKVDHPKGYGLYTGIKRTLHARTRPAQRQQRVCAPKGHFTNMAAFLYPAGLAVVVSLAVPGSAETSDHKWPSGREEASREMHTTQCLRSAAWADCHPT